MLTALRATVKFACLTTFLGLAACAGDASAPLVMQPLPPEQKMNMRVADVSAEPAQGVAMTPGDLDRIVQRVKAEMAAKYPLALQRPDAQDPAPSTKMKMVFTRYDEGNAFARFMLAGLGQIYIDADVIFVDASNGQALANYKVSKQFAFGGLVGGTTRIEDVEKGFAKSVVEILKPDK
jgi:hypothetical protein